tara:strand:- start:41 stop:283 length:243 start_codon:yes stop_codon:yes gene_type:complete
MICVKAEIPKEICDIGDELKAIYHSKDTAKVKKVSAEIVRPLRHKVLRPSLPFESSIMDLDDHDYTFHFCVKEEFRIIRA